MFKKLMYVALLGFVCKASGGYIGNPNVNNGWSCTSSIKVAGSTKTDYSWVQGNPIDTINGNGLDPDTGSKHNSGQNGNYTTFWGSSYYKNSPLPNKFQENIKTKGAVWIAYEFDQVYHLNNLELWNHNGFEKYKNYGWKNMTVATSADCRNWIEQKYHNLTMAPGDGYDGSSPNEYVVDDILPINQDAKWTVLICEEGGNFKKGVHRYMFSEVRFDGEPVPEPALIILTSIGGLFLMRKKSGRGLSSDQC